MNSTKERQARGRFWATSVCAMVVVGCQSTPPPAPPAPTPTVMAVPDKQDVREKQREKLKSLGFAESAEGFTLTLGTPLLFGTNSDQLSEAAAGNLKRLANELISVEIGRLKVHGHTDNTGGESLNQGLSERRAESVAKALAAGGLQLTDIERQGFAARFPVAPNDTEAGRSQNRRVVVIVPN